eukprot:1190444-Prorocentrum_minimum.AAC.1
MFQYSAHFSIISAQLFLWGVVCTLAVTGTGGPVKKTNEVILFSASFRHICHYSAYSLACACVRTYQPTQVGAAPVFIAVGTGAQRLQPTNRVLTGVPKEASRERSRQSAVRSCRLTSAK